MTTTTTTTPQRRLRALPLLALSSALLLAGCGSTMVNPATGRAERTVMSESAEIAEGQKGHAQVLKEYGAYPDKAVQAYVNELGQRLAKQSERSQLTWTFTVLDSPEINAFALPGGFVYVTRGIMAYMESEADLAGVMGHEIGHVTARHGAQRATKQQNAGLGVLAASVFGAVLEARGVAGAGQLANQVSQSVAAGLIASYGRDQELQADQLGAEYLVRSRFDPANMVDVIKVLKNQEQFAADTARAEGKTVNSGNNWLASHPSNDRRLQDIQNIASNYPPASYSDEGRARYLKVVENLAYGESASQGLTRGQSFYHEGLGIAMTAPAGWKIVNEADSLTLVNGTGDAGVVMQTVPAQAGNTPEEMIKALLKPTGGRIERTTLSGLQAARFEGTVADAQGQAKQVRATLVNGPNGQSYLLLPQARDAATLQRNRPALQDAEASFRAMTPADRAAAKPWLIRSVAYPRGGYAQLATQSPMQGARTEALLRLLNGAVNGQDPAPGQRVKVIVAAP
ncbi:MAG: hypothetical protein RJA98_960 [Pseudomonadota bacterium]